ncbi:hypothetical protein [Candidatus Entotheonella palauensis]|uniref:Uncharacterized protein n=1 Tax=Candidatus Entotheonella gemina TaxID=1429439 RepID=W4M207_9BACT|nr:hypothetical protein [Candidatus Entotheonella palauensis]ETX03986.1 MAG: hypothetical protein ETSY2_31400 [Candidatus Entotheonella gemina]
MGMFFQCMNSVAPGTVETMSAAEIDQLQAVFMQELFTNQVIMQELEQKMSQVLAAQQGGSSSP